VDRRPARLAGTRSKLAILTIVNDAEAVTTHKKRLDLTPA
jgi:hypothetical protein